MDTAEFMLGGGRTFYAVFMCHLALEKAAKGLYQRRLQQTPPRTHNLLYLLDRIGVRPPGALSEYVASLTEAQIATRYPEDLDALARQYPEQRVREIIHRAKEVLAWIRAQR
jgi:HEPN domain-containing protein